MEHVSKESFLKRHRQNSIIQIIWGNSCFTLVLKAIQCKLWPKLIFLLSRGLSSSLSLLQPTEVKRRPCTRFFAWGGIVQWCAVPGSVILKHLLTGKALWEQTWDWQVGFNSRDFVQLPKNPNPDAGAEHMLPDRNDVLGKRRASKCLSDTDSESSTALPCPFHSPVWASVSGWAWRCTAFFHYAAPRKYLTRGKFPTYHLLLSLSLFLLCMRYLLWAPYSPHTLILRGTFLLLLLRNHSLPKTLIFLTFFFIPALLEVISSLWKHQQRDSKHA